MFGGGPGRMMQQETSKPVDVGTTLGRLASYFKPYWLVLILVLVLILSNTYSQVITPELTGQSVDCLPDPGNRKPPGKPGHSQISRVIRRERRGANLRPTAGSTSCLPAPPPADYIAGLGKLILLILALYIFGAVMGGLQFFLMT